MNSDSSDNSQSPLAKNLKPLPIHSIADFDKATLDYLSTRRGDKYYNVMLFARELMHAYKHMASTLRQVQRARYK